ncbi:glutamine--fructose-6-phosphate transaminase (isomerizing) [Simiduia aestuariiviva]|uniref:Glutamine--fructose-6-phosphate aminotransferase [isomerizing] n=1 Tax=Simiduia aestuariiviva TaxID=1510459 RepID=A0A839UTT7_9GAMM|nr:glutamine--fructose-6-phosphate transaminase (isomerizing) [Simiduia aestuariiviva]MBB3169839.1 glucosamine--fructose-6-phosphate aminotransferase (isomerizing) [Simiduia aestuariiviva]
MCGIVGAVASRNVTGILVEGLMRLEYRGYDSAGVAVIDKDGALQIRKAVGKVKGLTDKLDSNPTQGFTGIAHTRWATHGKPTELNAHPHCSGDIAVVHNGIIENHGELREKLKAKGYEFVSETDTEVIAHLIHNLTSEGLSLIDALQAAVAQFDGAYALAVIDINRPNELVACRSGSPLVLGLGIEENFVASDQMALRQVTDRFVFLNEGDFVHLNDDKVAIYNIEGDLVDRDIHQLTDKAEVADKGQYRHYMLKEIFEQPTVLARTLQGRISKTKVLEAAFGADASGIFDKVEGVQIVACGTSYHAGLVAKYWMESIASIPCQVEVASEYRYRKVFVPKNTLFVTISQSGETADTLAALKEAKKSDYLASLVICNAPNSSLVRESDLVFMTQAGPEIGVASTKAFTTQLIALQLLTIALGRRHGLSADQEAKMVAALATVPDEVAKALTLDTEIKITSEKFADKKHALFLGRGVEYPVAMEGALKLKEISYIHAESYPAGELKHGPLALVDADMPIVAVAPNNELMEKLKSNLEEVQARGGKLFVFSDQASAFPSSDDVTVINVHSVPDTIAPMVYTIPLQLLSYHVAIVKGTDVDQPRNLAKSVTVE